MCIGQKGKTSLLVEGAVWGPETALPSDRMLYAHVGISISGSILNPLLSFPPSSRHSCFSLFPSAPKSMPGGNSQRPLQSHRGHSEEGAGGTVALSPPGHPRPQVLHRLLRLQTRSLPLCPPHPAAPLLPYAAPPPFLSLWSRCEAI